MRIILEVVQEMVIVITVTQMLAAILAIPVYRVITTFLYPTIGYVDAWAVVSVVTLGVVVVTWVADISKGVNL